MVDSADIYFIQHFADIYFSKSVCILACGGYQVSRTYCQVSFFLIWKYLLCFLQQVLSHVFICDVQSCIWYLISDTDFYVLNLKTVWYILIF